MAQTIITLCDPHLVEDDEQVAGESYRLGIEAPGQRWVWVSVDLCPEHAAALDSLALFVAKYGQPFKPDDTAPKSARPKRPSETRARVYPPPDLAKVADPATPYECDHPGCGRAFTSAHGIAMHVRRTHQGFDPAPTST